MVEDRKRWEPWRAGGWRTGASYQAPLTVALPHWLTRGLTVGQTLERARIAITFATGSLTHGRPAAPLTQQCARRQNELAPSSPHWQAID